MALNPVVTNTASQTCPETISSNCITYAGTLPDGLCGPASVTQVITNLQTQVNSSNSNSCCQGVFPPGNASCYTGNWVDVSSQIPTSGTGSGCDYTLAGFGQFQGYSSFTAIPTSNPSYRWTSVGDIELKGTFDIHLNVTTPTSGFIFINMTTLTPTCFPTGFTASQVVLAEVDLRPSISGNGALDFFKAYAVINYPTGLLQVFVQWLFPTNNNRHFSISLDGITFNLA